MTDVFYLCKIKAENTQGLSMLKQTIILATQVNESEKLKSLAVFNKKTINTHYFNALELARYLLQLSGIVIKQQFVSDEEVGARLYNDIKAIKYFENFSFNDVLYLISSINDLRRYIVKDEANTINDKLPKAPFLEKNDAIKKAYGLMTDLFGKKNLIDEVGIIRYAFENTKEFKNIDFINYDNEYPLPIALINKAAGKEVTGVVNNKEKPLVIESYTKAFGQTNEVENILDYINKKNIPFDQCLVAAAETKDYANIFNNYKDVLGLPITIGTGTILLETRSGKLFSIINDWKDNYYNTDFLKRVIFDESFNLDEFKKTLEVPADDFREINKALEYPESISLDSIITTVGDMKMSFDKDDNNQKLEEYRNLLDKYSKEGFNADNTKRRTLELPYVECFVNELNNGLSAFIGKYAVINDSKDENALSKILKYLYYQHEYGISEEDTKKAIFAQNVGRESVKDGTLYFTSINHAVSCLRPYLFIIGLSSNNFPGSNKENPILLDEDYESFGVSSASTRGIRRNKDAFFKLINEAKDHNVSIHLSYAFYNSQSLKEQNASSVIFESYKKENGDTKTIEDLNDEFKEDDQDKYKVVEFFNNDVLPVSPIGRAVSSNLSVEFNEQTASTNNTPVDLTKVLFKPNGYSASSVTNYANCPYLFYLTEVLKVEQPEETDVFEVIAPNEYGTLAHYLLETLDKAKMTTKELFGQYAGQRFMEYLTMHRPTNMVTARLEKDRFVEMMENAYELEGSTKTLFKEEDISIFHKESGILIHGFPDKVIDNGNGTVRVIDYKTGRKVKHYAYDIPSMIQCTMYSYIIEHLKHIRVSSFEYWYLRSKHITYSTDNGKTMVDHYANLEATLNNLKHSLTTGEFIPNSSHCKDCYYKGICMMKGGKK